MSDMGARGSGKSSVNWESAFAYYASLPPGERTYAAVGLRFGVSARTVEAHGRTGQWKERLRTIDSETAARTVDALVDARVAEIHKIRRLIEASLIGYADRLRDGMRMSPADLERLNRLSLALLDEVSQPRSAALADDGSPVRERTPEHTAAVLDALAQTGALEALGLTRSDINQDTDNDKVNDDEGGADESE